MIHALFYNANTWELFKVFSLDGGRTSFIDFAEYCALHAHKKPVIVELVNDNMKPIDIIKF